MMNSSSAVLPPPVPRPFEIVGDNPGPRCGHTLTAVYANETDPNTAKLILFGTFADYSTVAIWRRDPLNAGGATALESGGKGEANTGGGAGGGRLITQCRTVGQGGVVGIRLAGATSEVHVFDVFSGVWKKITPLGEAPSPRAAHAGAAVGSMVVIQGGIGPAGLASEDLHVLDFTDFGNPKWHRVIVHGVGPGARYAHVLALVANRFLVVMGGNDGKNTLGDAWALDTSEKPYKWRKICEADDMPSARMYASSAPRSDGLLLLCGGRDAKGTPLGDAYGFARHRDGRWEWATAPGPMPTPRYQHSAIFVKSRLHITGGAVGGGKMVDEELSVVSLDTQAGVWCQPENSARRLGDHMRRCRHTTSSIGDVVFIYGGLRGSTLLSDFLVGFDGYADEMQIGDPASKVWQEWISSGRELGDITKKDAEEAAAFSASFQLNSNAQSTSEPSSRPPIAQEVQSFKARPTQADEDSPVDVKLWNRAIVVPNESAGNLKSLVRQLSLDQLDYEGKRVSLPINGDSPLITRQTSHMPGTSTIHRHVIETLLKPKSWRPSAERRFFLTAEEISEMCEEVEKVFKDEATVLELNAPVKIFGDLHGQFKDLMRLFEEYGYPNVGGDITYIDYLFLGDYVDRGAHSLETICLLLALKIMYPRNIHLIRGNHEAADINALFGFRLECLERLGDPDGIWAWQRINTVFNWLPLAARIEGKIFCMHGGIGRSIETVRQISTLERPLTLEDGGLVLMDLLWSDPTTNDSIEGVQPSPRGPGLVTFGPDRVKEFCKNNGLQMIIRAHECVMDGFERFAQGHLITLFSATNYCGTANNAGAILVMGRNLVLVPKLIHPLPPRADDDASSDDLDSKPAEAWMQSINDERPPTPPRGRPTDAKPMFF